MQCTAKQHKNCDIASNERLFHLCIVCFQPIGPHYFEILSMHVHAFSSSTVYLKKACESRQTFDVSGLLRLLRILSPNSTFIIAKTLYMYSNFWKKQTTTKKPKSIHSHQFVFLVRKFVLFVVIMADRITIKIQKYICACQEVISRDYVIAKQLSSFLAY